MQSQKVIYLTTRARGYTLIELMIVLAIAAILLALGAPSIRGVLNHNAEASAVNVLISGIASARTYAVTHKRQVVLESREGDWSKGFYIKPGSIVNESISDTAFEDSRITISSDAPFTFLAFDRLGRATPANSTFTVCNENIQQGVEIDVNIFGKAHIARDANGNLIRVAC